MTDPRACPCRAWRPPNFVDPGDFSSFPETWRRARDVPGLRAGAWAGGVWACAQCGAYWSLLYQPKDMYYSEVLLLPPGFAAVLAEDGALDDVWPFLGAEDRTLADLVLGYFRGADYPADEALNRLVRELGRARADAARAEAVLRCLAAATRGGNPFHEAALRRRDPPGPYMDLRDPGPLLGALARTDGVRGPVTKRTLRDLAREVVADSFRSVLGAPFDRVAAAAEDRGRLLRAAGLPERAPEPEPPAPRPAVPEDLPEPPAPLAAPGELLARAGARLLAGYAHFLPGALYTWLLMEAVAPKVAYAPDLARTFLFTTCAVWYAAAAAKAAGRWERGVFSLALSRMAASLDTVALLLLGLAASLPLVALGAALGDLGDEATRRPLDLGFAAVLLLLLLRFWPVATTAFLYKGRSRWSLAAGAQVWSGPGLATAWRMTGRPGAFRKATLPVLASGALLLGAYFPARAALAEAPLAGALLNALLYAGILPYLAALADTAAAQLRVPTPWDAWGEG